MKNSMGFWAFAATASFGLFYENHQDLIDSKVIPEVKHLAGIAEQAQDPRKAMLEKTFGIVDGKAFQNPPPRKRDIFDEHMKMAEFKPLPKSVYPVYVESEDEKELDRKLGFDVSDPGYCTEDPCIVK